MVDGGKRGGHYPANNIDPMRPMMGEKNDPDSDYSMAFLLLLLLLLLSRSFSSGGLRFYFWFLEHNETSSTLLMLLLGCCPLRRDAFAFARNVRTAFSR